MQLIPLFTLDYEIHGNGEGDPHSLMVQPTNNLLALFDTYGAKLTIMADIAEILRFKQFAEESGSDLYHHREIEDQLRAAVANGHDVQLHIHSSYFRARPQNNRWEQDWTEYDFASLPLDRMRWMIHSGKSYLEALLRPVAPDYRCNVFRAANWSVSPSMNVLRALRENGIAVDTSVFKYGRRGGLVCFDYSSAPSALIPWRPSDGDICTEDPEGELWEFPIYTELRNVCAFATPLRLMRVLRSLGHRIPTMAAGSRTAVAGRAMDGRRGVLKNLLMRHAWKADFNQCTSGQLVAALERAHRAHQHLPGPLPFVLIGHSKLFTRINRWSLRPFLRYVADRPDRFRFGKFADFHSIASATQSVPAKA